MQDRRMRAGINKYSNEDRGNIRDEEEDCRLGV